MENSRRGVGEPGRKAPVRLFGLSGRYAARGDPQRRSAAAHAAADAPPPVVDAGAVLRGGRTVVAADGAERTFRAGEGIVELVGAAHYGENRGEEAAELVMFCAGAGNLPLSEREE